MFYESGVKKSIMGRSSVGKMDESSTNKIEAIPLTTGGHLVFQNEAKNIPRQDFMVMNICCKFEKAS